MAEKNVVDGDDPSCSTEDMTVIASNVVVKDNVQHDVTNPNVGEELLAEATTTIAKFLPCTAGGDRALLLHYLQSVSGFPTTLNMKLLLNHIGQFDPQQSSSGSTASTTKGDETLANGVNARNAVFTLTKLHGHPQWKTLTKRLLGDVMDRFNEMEKDEFRRELEGDVAGGLEVLVPSTVQGNVSNSATENNNHSPTAMSGLTDDAASNNATENDNRSPTAMSGLTDDAAAEEPETVAASWFSFLWNW